MATTRENTEKVTTSDNVEKAPIEQHVETTADIGDTKDARAAAAGEKSTTLMQALKNNKKAALWSIALSTTVIMEGYDVGKRPTIPRQALHPDVDDLR